jgi:hypothetical protein
MVLISAATVGFGLAFVKKKKRGFGFLTAQ